MTTNDIIFQLKDGVKIHDIERRFDLSTGQAKRMYDIKLAIEATDNGRLLSDDDDLSDEEIFDRFIYPEMSEAEKKLFRTYIVSGLDKIDSDNLLGRMKENSERDSSFIQYPQNGVVYKIDYSPGERRQISRNLISPGIKNMNCPQAWTEGGTRGSGITVAVIDSGIDHNHIYIKNNLWSYRSPDCTIVHGYNFIEKRWGAVEDRDGHGTHCAGIVGAFDLNDNKVSVAPDAKIMTVKIFQKYGSGQFTSMRSETPLCAQAIWFAAKYGAQISSNSWSFDGTPEEDDALLHAIDYAHKEGCIVVFGAGNDGSEITNRFPGNCPQIIAVAGTTESNSLTCTSNYVSGPMVAAQGQDVWSLNANTTDGFVRNSGTSMAAPHVAGLAALLLSKNNALSTDEIRTDMLDTGLNVQDYPSNKGPGKRVQALCCVRQSLGRPPGKC